MVMSEQVTHARVDFLFHGGNRGFGSNQAGRVESNLRLPVGEHLH